MARLLATGEELALMGSWELDLRSGETVWSDGMYRILGLPPAGSGARRREVLEHVHPDDRSAWSGCWRTWSSARRRCPSAGSSIEVRMVRADGSVRELRAMGRLERDEEGSRRAGSGRCRT